MFGGPLSGVAGATSTEDRLESLKRQFNPDQGGDFIANGLSMNLQDQYDQHEAEQHHPAKRHRGMGMNVGAGPGDFGAFGAGASGMNGGMGMGMGMGNPGANAANSMSGMNGNPMGGAGAGGGGMNGMMNSMAGSAGGMNPMAGAGAGAGMNGMNMNGVNMNMNGMHGATMNSMASAAGGMNGHMTPMNMNGAMNPMNMAAARAGMLGPMAGAGGASTGSGFPHLNAQGMPSAFSSAMENDIAAAFYLNNFEGPSTGMGLLGQRGAGLGFMSQGGSLGGFLPSSAGGNPFGGMRPYPYDGLGAAAGFSQGPGGPAGSAANAAAMGGVGLPASNARRAQLIALMDMESELQQQEAAKVGSANFQGGQMPGQGGAPDFMSAQRGNGLGGGLGGGAGLGAVSALGGGRRDDSDVLNGHGGVTQIPEPPMDLPTFSTASTPTVLPLPPVIEEGAAAHYSQRAHIPLGIDEDNNWLTEFQCFIRFDLIEVVQASRHVDQVNGNDTRGKTASNNGGETFQQVGVRCRYCAHLHPGQRASRSSAFPSSIRQLYQSFTMMLRDHFEQCSEIPPLRKKLFSELKAKNSQGAYDSKQYWIYAAEKLGMIDSEHGIQMTADSQAKARRKPPFGTVGDTPHTHSPPKLLVTPEDIRVTSDFLYTLMSQVQVVHLIDSERVGKRKTLRVGLPGFGCRYCCHVGRCGLSRMFPLRRRMLPGKVNEIYEHVKRCTLFPTKEKELLARLKAEDKAGPEQEKEFFDRIWERLGCESEVKK